MFSEQAILVPKNAPQSSCAVKGVVLRKESYLLASSLGSTTKYRIGVLLKLQDDEQKVLCFDSATLDKRDLNLALCREGDIVELELYRSAPDQTWSIQEVGFGVRLEMS